MDNYKYIQDDDYICIPASLRKVNGLKGSELIVTAIIFRFSLKDGSKFYGSLRYLCEWTGLSKPAMITVLQKLVKDGIIEKEEAEIDGVKRCYYTYIGGGKETLPLVKKLNHSGKETLIGVVKKLKQGGKETLPNNINIENKDNNKLTNVSKTPTKKPVLDYSFIEDEYIDVFRTWLMYKRDTFKETYKTQQSLQAAYNRLKKLSGNNPAMAREIVEQSMANNWKGLFDLKTINNNVYGNNRTTSEQREADVIQQGQRIIERLLREDDERTEQLRQQGELPNFVQPEQTA